MKHTPNVCHESGWLSANECDALENNFLRDVPLYRVRYTSNRYKRICNTPCYSYFYADNVHGGVPPWLSDLARRVELRLNQPTGYFNAIICRLYKDGSDKIDWHTDLRRNLDDPDMVIGSVSLGPAARTFTMRPVTNVWSMKPKGDPDAKSVGGPDTYSHYVLGRGDLFGMMDRECQSKYEHAVLPDKKCTTWRININFRHILPEWKEEGLYRFYRYCVYGDSHPLSDRHLGPMYIKHTPNENPETFPTGSVRGIDAIRGASSRAAPKSTLISHGFTSVKSSAPSSGSDMSQNGQVCIDT